MAQKKPPKTPARKRELWRWVFGKKPPQKPRKTESLLKKLKRIFLRDLTQSEDVQSLYQEANERLKTLRSLGYESKAMYDFEKERGHKWFGETNKKRLTKFEALSELYAVRRFLADSTSTVEGHLADEAVRRASRFSELIGTKYQQAFGVRYDASQISKDVARMSYEVYRLLEQHDQSLIYGKGAFGSENTINMIFDITTDLGVSNIDFSDQKDFRESSEFLLKEVEKYLQSRIIQNSPEKTLEYKQTFSRASFIINSFRQ